MSSVGASLQQVKLHHDFTRHACNCEHITFSPSTILHETSSFQMRIWQMRKAARITRLLVTCNVCVSPQTTNFIAGPKWGNFRSVQKNWWAQAISIARCALVDMGSKMVKKLQALGDGNQFNLQHTKLGCLQTWICKQDLISHAKDTPKWYHTLCDSAEGKAKELSAMHKWCHVGSLAFPCS